MPALELVLAVGDDSQPYQYSSQRSHNTVQYDSFVGGKGSKQRGCAQNKEHIERHAAYDISQCKVEVVFGGSHNLSSQFGQ